MCNINALFLKEKKDINGFLMATTSNSFTRNNNGEGFYCDNNNTTFKSDNKINYNDFKDINQSKIILTHQRLSTSGFNKKYHHPFINKDFVLVHNGIINQFKNKKGSDSYGFFNKFNDEFYKNLKKDKNREKAILKAIKNLFLKDIGSYSILILDKKTNISYYFKDSYTKIEFFKNDEGLYITTLDENELFLNLLSNKKFKQLDIKPNKIYSIKPNCDVFDLGFIRVEVEVEIKNKKGHLCAQDKKNLEVEVEHFEPNEEQLKKFEEEYLTNKELDDLMKIRNKKKSFNGYGSYDYNYNNNYMNDEDFYDEYESTNKFLENEVLK